MTLYPYADRFSAMYGKRRAITRAELRDYLLAAQQDGLDVVEYFGRLYGTDAPVYDVAESARRIANIPRDITILSLGGNVRDIQYDQPGTMHPQQFAALTFVASEKLRGDEYIQRHAQRVVRIDGDALPEDDISKWYL